jgi:hypothetical protein
MPAWEKLRRGRKRSCAHGNVGVCYLCTGQPMTTGPLPVCSHCGKQHWPFYGCMTTDPADRVIRLDHNQ